MTFPQPILMLSGNKTLSQAISEIGKTSVFCLDAGDLASYTGSGQEWDDTSGNTNDFYRGADVTETTDDPTFNGVAGALTSSEYWSFDGGDRFNLVAASNPAELNTLHENSVQWWCFGMLYYPASSAANFIMATGANVNSDIGIGLAVRGDSGDVLVLSVGNGVALAILKSSTATMTEGAWNTFGVSLDEAGGATASILHINGTNETFDGTITLPSSSDSTHKMTLGCRVNAGTPGDFLANTARLGCIALGIGTLTTQNFTDLRTMIGQERFGL